VELKEIKPKRTCQQNRYLHAIFGYVGSLLGERADFVKTYYFKRVVNPELFIVHRVTRLGEHIEDLRSSAELDTSAMTIAIERFRVWCAQEHPMEIGYIPSPDEHSLIQHMEQEIQRSQHYL
jgi:hypothetical protein